MAIKVGLQVGQLIMQLHEIATESFHLLLTPYLEGFGNEMDRFWKITRALQRFFLGNACYVLEGFSEASLVPRAANLSRATSIFDWTFSMLAITLPTFSMASQITTGEIEY